MTNTTASLPENRPLILITNDDGIQAKGLNSLVDMLREIGDIVVVAPDAPRSGQSSAISSESPLRVTPVADQPGYRAYKTNGTPVDCIKLAVNQILRKRPHLIVSGINHGSNAGACIIYSGTMGAVLEGCLIGIPSVGFSLCSHDSNADFSSCQKVIKNTCRQILGNGLPDQVCLNVNIPVVPTIQGIRICRQAKGYWTEEYDHRVDPHGRDYYWLTGRFINLEPDSPDTDEWALANGYISIVPCTTDLTAREILPDIAYLIEKK